MTDQECHVLRDPPAGQDHACIKLQEITSNGQISLYLLIYPKGAQKCAGVYEKNARLQTKGSLNPQQQFQTIDYLEENGL